MSQQALFEAHPEASLARPCLGFLGVGWIGRHRMQAILGTGAIDVAAIADPSPEMAAEAGKLAPDARLVSTLDDILDLGVDGVVIATPSAMHAEQSIQALERGVAVFCQKPLGRTTAEVQAVVDAARKADRLLSVDLSIASRTACAASARSSTQENWDTSTPWISFFTTPMARTSPGSTIRLYPVVAA
jgi:hypothetical protein